MGKRSKKYHEKLNIARETPDKIEKTFNLESADFQRALDAWVRAFRTKMLVKHSAAEDFDIKISTDDSFNYGDKTVLVHLECVLPEKEMADVQQA